MQVIPIMHVTLIISAIQVIISSAVHANHVGHIIYAGYVDCTVYANLA